MIVLSKGPMGEGNKCCPFECVECWGHACVEKVYEKFVEECRCTILWCSWTNSVAGTQVVQV